MVGSIVGSLEALSYTMILLVLDNNCVPTELISYLTYWTLSGSSSKNTAASVGFGALSTANGTMKLIVKVSLQEGPDPGTTFILTGHVIAIF